MTHTPLLCDGCHGLFEEHRLQLVPDFVVVGDDEPVFYAHTRLCHDCTQARQEAVKEATVAGFAVLGAATALLYALATMVS